MPSTGSISALALFLTRRAAIRATSFATGSSATSMRWGGDPTACHIQVLDCSGSRRWLATQQEARNGGQGGYKYRNRTRNFKKDVRERQPREKNAVSESVTPPLDAETPSTVSFSPEELVPGLAMLERIVKDLEAAGSTFILPPRTNAEAIELVLEPFRRLASIGVKGEFVVGGCIRHPELFKLLTSKGDETVKVISSLVDICGMSYEDGLRLVGYYPDVAKQGETATQLALEALIACGLPAGKPLGSTVKRCPPLLFARPVDEIRQAAEALRDFFSRKQITMILQRCPQVLLKNVEEIEEKYEYIFYQMGLEGDEFTQCARWGSLPLEDIIERHEFLAKCGRFTRPDAKRPQVKMENPALNKILDSSDDHFATQVAQVSREEWIIYRALCTKSAELATKDRPFERVKPSMRKAYERRRKETADVPDHVFDVSSSGSL